MKKNLKKEKNSKAVSSAKSTPYISCKHLAEFHGIEVGRFVFGVAEISYGEGSVDILPVIAVLGSSLFICLETGIAMTPNPSALGFKTTLYKASVRFDDAKKEFIFTSPVGATASISPETLEKNFGNAVHNYVKV